MLAGEESEESSEEISASSSELEEIAQSDQAQLPSPPSSAKIPSVIASPQRTFSLSVLVLFNISRFLSL